ncbi:MAG: GNAT family N-acetyltransferase [Alphaproteobacteria bacterium]|nr:GNAT family N-acetyltransferase [Alphaproteobacteria bacterium]
MNGALKIRRARVNDIDQIADLLVSFHKHFQKLDHESKRIRRDKIKSEIKRLSFDGRPLLYIYVAEIDGQIVGTISFYNGWTTDTSTMFHVPYLFITPEYRGSRVVFTLLSALRQIARKTNVTRICFTVYGKNTPTKKLYGHIGAKYWADEDEHFMYFTV